MLGLNTPEFSIWGIPPYLFFACIATVVAVCTFIVLLAEKGYRIDRYLKILVVAIGGLIILARLFGCLSGIFGAIGRHEEITWDTVRNTGIVFYGGLIGLLVTYHIVVSKTKQSIHIDTINILVVTIPLFHSISRIGCFLGGCCYGIECNGLLSVLYTTDIFGEVVTARRLPVQLIEALFNFALFLYLLLLLRRDDWKRQNILERYLIIYSVFRFILEFFRGDIIRGIIAGVSFSQVISIGIWVAIIVRIKLRKNREDIIYESS